MGKDLFWFTPKVQEESRLSPRRLPAVTGDRLVSVRMGRIVRLLIMQVMATPRSPGPREVQKGTGLRPIDQRIEVVLRRDIPSTAQVGAVDTEVLHALHLDLREAATRRDPPTILEGQRVQEARIVPRALEGLNLPEAQDPLTAVAMERNKSDITCTPIRSSILVVAEDAFLRQR